MGPDPTDKVPPGAAAVVQRSSSQGVGSPVRRREPQQLSAIAAAQSYSEKAYSQHHPPDAAIFKHRLNSPAPRVFPTFSTHFSNSACGTNTHGKSSLGRSWRSRRGAKHLSSLGEGHCPVGGVARDFFTSMRPCALEL